MATKKKKGARNLKGKESEQSKARRKKQGRLSDEETVQHIRTNPTNRMPTKGTDFAKGVRDFFDPPRPTTTTSSRRKKK